MALPVKVKCRIADVVRAKRGGEWGGGGGGRGGRGSTRPLSNTHNAPVL